MSNDKVITREESRSFDRYLFDTDFFEIDVSAREEAEEAQPAHEGIQGVEEPPKEEAITKEDLAQAESAGYAAGLADGKAQASEDFKRELHTHTSALSSSLTQLDALKDELSAELSQKALRLLAGTLPALLADARENYPEQLLQRTADKLLEMLKEEKVLAVTTAPKTKDFLLDHIADAEGLKTQLKPAQLKESTELEVGDCIIEWETGGVTLSHDDILQQITEVILAASPSMKKKAKEAVKAAPEEAAPAEENAELPQDDAETPQAESPEKPEIQTAPPAEETAEPQETSDDSTTDEPEANPETPEKEQ